MPSVLFNILIVDSNADDAHKIETLLRSAFSSGVDIHTAVNMEAAKSHMAIRDIHLAIADMNVPPFAGPGIIDHLRRVQPSLPIICVTRMHDPGLSLAVMAAGAAMLIDKGELRKPDELLTTAVVNILAESRQRVATNGLTKQIDAVYKLLQHTHERLERVLNAIEQHANRIQNNTQRIDHIDATVRDHEKHRRNVLALLWALATAVMVTLADRLI